VELKSTGSALPMTSTITNASGDYAFSVREGQYEIKVRQSSYQGSSRVVNVSTGGSPQADFSLQPPSVNIAQQLPGSRTAALDRGQISGRITDARTGKPIFGALVAIEGFSPIRTDQQGSYALANVTAGEHQMRISSAGYSDESKKIRARAGSSSREDFALRPQTTQPIVNPRGIGQIETRVPARAGSIALQAIDAKTRGPIAGVTISITGQRSVLSDSTGRQLVANLPPGIYQVSAVKAGYSAEQRTIVVRSGETTTLSFNLTPRAAARR